MTGTSADRYVYLGPEGTFAEQALLTIPEAERAERIPARSVPEALDVLRAGGADWALVPMENSIGGQVGVTFDELIAGSPLMIVREVVLPIQFSLASARPGELGSIAKVGAHPQAIAQCRKWLRTNLGHAEVIETLSNSASAIGAAEGSFDAAICPPSAIARYSLSVLAGEIADHSGAMTRFALVARPGPAPEPTGHDVTTLAVWIAHDRVGALLAVLTELAVRGVNLTRIESRPTGERLGRYMFFLDCTGHVREARFGEALQGLRRVCADLRFLGSYPRVTVGLGDAEQPVPAPAGLSDADFADAAAWIARLRDGQFD